MENYSISVLDELEAESIHELRVCANAEALEAGANREQERSRTQERVFSFRDAPHRAR